jgi:chloride channel protein, CIC family
MRAAPESLSGEPTVRGALEQIRSSESRTWLVTGQQGLMGVVNLRTLARAAAEGPDQQALGELINASTFPHVHPDQGFDIALERLGANQLELLPVVSRADVHQLEGIVTLHDVLQSYGVGRE